MIEGESEDFFTRIKEKCTQQHKMLTGAIESTSHKAMLWEAFRGILMKVCIGAIFFDLLFVGNLYQLSFLLHIGFAAGILVMAFDEDFLLKRKFDLVTKKTLLEILELKLRLHRAEKRSVNENLTEDFQSIKAMMEELLDSK